MHIICLTPLEVGVYNDHESDHITEPPEGWAMIPEDMELPSTFPRLGSIEAEEITYTYEVEVEKKNEETGEVEVVKEQRERVILTVTRMTEGTLPEPVEPEPTDDELQWQAITDLEIAQMEYEQALTDLEIAQLEG
jgi:hypothetical protein